MICPFAKKIHSRPLSVNELQRAKMPKVTVQAYATLGDILKSRDVKVSTSAKTVGELIDFLTEQYGSAFKEKLIDSRTKELHSSYRILINGRDVESLEKLKTLIREGDKIVFFPPVSGG